MQAVKMGSMVPDEDDGDSDKALAGRFGYDDVCEVQGVDEDQVTKKVETPKCHNENLSRSEEVKLNYIKPIPTQLLTVFTDEACKNPVHIDLDSGASLNYIREDEAIKNNFVVIPNKQLSTLGDGKTKLQAIGEIDVLFFRNNWTVKFRAVVAKELQEPLIGGTVFMIDNNIEQDLSRKLIHIHDKKYTVQETSPLSLLPIKPIVQQISSRSQDFCHIEHNKLKVEEKVKQKTKSTLLTFNSMKVILPGQSLEVSVKGEEQEQVAIQPWEQNKNLRWPQPQLCTIKDGKVNIENSTEEPIILSKDVRSIKINKTTILEENPDQRFYSQKLPNMMSLQTQKSEISEIKIGEDTKEHVKELLNAAHDDHEEVFNKDLTNGYNDFYGRHRCHLNWASNERPAATKVKVPNYNHDLKGLQQELMDHLTEQEVLLVPQEHDIVV